MTDLLETVQEASNFERQYKTLVDWIHSEKPTPTRTVSSPFKKKKKTRYISSFCAIYGQVDENGSGNGLIRVNWKGKPHQYDTLLSANALTSVLGLPNFKVFFNAPKQTSSEITDLPALTYNTSALDSLVTSLVDSLEPVAVFAAMHFDGLGTVLRVGWNNLPRLYDTWEIREHLVSTFDDAEDTILRLEKNLQTKLSATPDLFDNLPSPLTPFDIEDAASNGFNPSRRQALFTYLQGVYKIRHKLALCYRPRIFTGSESTSAKGERRWGVFKFANCTAGLGQKAKALSKLTNTGKVAKVTMARAERTVVERESKSVSKVRKKGYANGIPPSVAILLTNEAVTRCEVQLGNIAHYDMTVCDCGENLSWILRSTKTNTKYTVSMDQESMLVCSCAYPAHNGLPCGHMLAIVVGVLGGSISAESCHPRWWKGMHHMSKTLRSFLWDKDGYFSEKHVTSDKGARFFIIPSLQHHLVELDCCDGTCVNTSAENDDELDQYESDDDVFHDNTDDNDDNTNINHHHHVNSDVQTQTAVYKGFETSVATIKQMLSAHPEVGALLPDLMAPEVGALLPDLMAETIRQLTAGVHTPRTFETQGNVVVYGGRKVSKGSNDKRVRQAFEKTSMKKRGKRRRVERDGPHDFNEWQSE